jgi:hypothetical protein
MWVGIDIGIRHLAICELNVRTIERWVLVDLIDGMPFKSTDDLSMSEIHCLMAYLMVTLFPNPKRYEHVRIESQPLGKYSNPKTTLVSHVIYNHFFASMLDVKLGDPLQSVLFVAGARKFNSAWLILYNERTYKTHAARKKLSVRLCAKLLIDMEIETPFDFTTKKGKVDDLADAFLLIVQDPWFNR